MKNLTFGKGNQGDYISTKKLKAQNINYENLNKNMNYHDLNVNLISNLDLSGVSVIQSNELPFNSPTNINNESVPFIDYKIDPSGDLFGNTSCGINNYVERITIPIYNSSKTLKLTKCYPLCSKSGNLTFGKFKESISASDYTRIQKIKAQKLNYNIFGNIINPYDLYVNLISKLDLSGVSVIQSNENFSSPTSINTSSVPFIDYTIDPSGELFGNTVCGINNYVEYMVYNPPK